MAIPIGSNFDLKAQLPIDERLLFDTVADMKAYDSKFLPDMYLCQVKQTGKLYTYNVNNALDPLTGRWVEFKAGTSSGYQHDQTTPSATWTVSHNLNNQRPIVKCFDDTGDEIVGDISYLSYNVVIITFCIPLKGTCYVR